MEEPFVALATAYLPKHLPNFVHQAPNGSLDELREGHFVGNIYQQNSAVFSPDFHVFDKLPYNSFESTDCSKILQTPFEFEELEAIKVSEAHYSSEDFLTGESPKAVSPPERDLLTSGGRDYAQGYSHGFKEGFQDGFDKGFGIASSGYELRIEDRNQEIIRLTEIINKNPKYDFRGAKIGNVSDVNIGSMCAHTNENIDDISSLVAALKDLVKTFSKIEKENLTDELEALESDIKVPEKRDSNRIGRRLQRLKVMGTAVAVAERDTGLIAKANEFTSNIQELSEKIGINMSN